MDRRTFLSVATAAAGAVTGILVGIPILGSVLAPLRRRATDAGPPWIPLGSVGTFDGGKPQRVSIPVTVEDGWETTTNERAAWVVRGAAGDVKVFSGVCPHLGCSVKWLQEHAQFGCPCHESGFTPQGARLKGPARRGLDELPTRVTGDQLEIQWVDYVANVADKKPVGGAATTSIGGADTTSTGRGA
jgi:menaquinol-cytochrome c reductase iron-sulfur subunit